MNKKFHLVVVDMGYGHQRAAYPLLEWSLLGNINLNDYEGASSWEKSYWLNSRKTYEKISYFKKIPIVGSLVFKLMDHFQRIPPFYPHRSLINNTLQQKMFFRAVKKGVGKNLINKLNENPIPLVTSFFVAAYSAEYYGYKGSIYCIICDADVSRAWAPIDPKNSKIIYLATNSRTKKRLMMYGVSENNIKITGFPLPLENKGEDESILKKNLGLRLKNLNLDGSFEKKFQSMLQDNDIIIPNNSDKPLTITFAVGGAGAQRELGGLLLKNLLPHIKNKKIKLNLVAGSRSDVNNYFQELINALKINNHEGVRIIYHPQKVEYFKLFNKCLGESDILWTKPSELSFYSALGLPIIMSEPVGSQEVFNREWLIEIGAGLDSLNLNQVSEWIFDWQKDGRLARAALNAYLNAPRNGTENIIKEVFKEINL
jgi:hypothetical protein